MLNRNMRALDLYEAQMYFGGFAHMPPRSDVIKYMRGECGYVALAFNALYGYEIVQVGHHVVAKDPDGNYWDIRGKMNDAQVVNGVGGDISELKPVTPEYVIDQMEKGFASEAYFMPSRLKKAKALVKSLTATS